MKHYKKQCHFCGKFHSKHERRACRAERIANTKAIEVVAGMFGFLDDEDNATSNPLPWMEKTTDVMTVAKFNAAIARAKAGL